MRIVATGIHKALGGRPVLAGVDFEVQSGEIVVVAGPSGSGKSTLLGILGGLIPPDAGNVAWLRDGCAPLEPGHAAWIPQSPYFLFGRSVLDNAALSSMAEGRPTSAALEIARENLTLVGLGARSTDLASVLSGGELQRLALARAISSQSCLLLADEPTGNLDAKATDEVIECFRAVGVNRAMVIATHDSAVRAIATRVHECSGQGL